MPELRRCIAGGYDPNSISVWWGNALNKAQRVQMVVLGTDEAVFFAINDFNPKIENSNLSFYIQHQVHRKQNNLVLISLHIIHS